MSDMSDELFGTTKFPELWRRVYFCDGGHVESGASYSTNRRTFAADVVDPNLPFLYKLLSFNTSTIERQGEVNLYDRQRSDNIQQNSTRKLLTESSANSLHSCATDPMSSIVARRIWWSGDTRAPALMNVEAVQWLRYAA